MLCDFHEDITVYNRCRPSRYHICNLVDSRAEEAQEKEEKENRKRKKFIDDTYAAYPLSTTTEQRPTVPTYRRVSSSSSSSGALVTIHTTDRVARDLLARPESSSDLQESLHEDEDCENPQSKGARPKTTGWSRAKFYVARSEKKERQKKKEGEKKKRDGDRKKREGEKKKKKKILPAFVRKLGSTKDMPEPSVSFSNIRK